MTAVSPEAAAPAARLPRRWPGAAGTVVVLGSAALLARPLAVRAVADPTALLVALFVALGLIGLRWPLEPATDTPARTGDRAPMTPLAPAMALALGVGAFAVGRLLGPGGTLALPVSVAPLLLNSLAAIAEEAFFRRLLYGLLEPRGPAVAVVGSALCFAAVHVTVWGASVLPLDLAAGLILGWQRAVTGRWTVPAVTHVAANVLAVL
ncbi:MAG TPA: CPBP family intramembrane glutamic endopeptidase [Acidimicrobiales bacterium]|nr:CPBP family intramembrane glutamic endopeptidase [Acidimicrobiales bacterium]